MGQVLQSSTEARLRRCLHDLTLDLYTRRGAFWITVSGIRRRWDITAPVQLPPKQWWLYLPSGVPEAATPPPDHDEGAPWHLDPSSELTRWMNELAELHDSVIRESCRFPGGVSKSRAQWSQFLSACVLYDPPPTELLTFADQMSFEPESILPPDVLLWVNAPRMTAPAIVNLRDPDQVDADWKWFSDRLLNELADRLKPRGVDLRVMAADVLRTTGLAQEFEERRRDNPPEPYIDVDPDTSAEDIREAHRIVREAYQVEHPGGRAERDPLTAVQCAVLKRLGWTEKAIATHFGSTLQKDSYGIPRRSGKVRGHVQRGEEILAERENPAGSQPST